MTWFKVDDSLLEHPKWFGLSDAAQLLWLRCGVWSARYLTEGLLPTALVEKHGGKECAAELVAAGLWERAGGGYQFHDWLDYQPSKAQVLNLRQKTAARVAQHRARTVERNAVTNAAPVPSRPVPDPVSTETSISLPTAEVSSVAPERAAAAPEVFVLAEDPRLVAASRGRQRWDAATGGLMFFDHRPGSRWHQPFAAIGDFPEEQWKIAAPVVTAQSSDPRTRKFVTPRSVVDHWHRYSRGEHPGLRVVETPPPPKPKTAAELAHERYLALQRTRPADTSRDAERDLEARRLAAFDEWQLLAFNVPKPDRTPKEEPRRGFSDPVMQARFEMLKARAAAELGLTGTESKP